MQPYDMKELEERVILVGVQESFSEDVEESLDELAELCETAGALVVAGITILMFFYYRFMSYRTFGGITGDLAGYFLQMCELWMLIGTVVLVHVI